MTTDKPGSTEDEASITVGIALIKLLQHYGVEHVFGIPGVHTIELYRGLANSQIKHHTPRHEQGAGFMADGYARVSGKPGVCFVITGPGLTNIATAMGQALADSIPMLVISSVNSTLNTPHPQGMLHEMPNQLGFSSQVSRYSHTVVDADDLANSLAKAFSIFSSARPGPVHLQLSVPLLGKITETALLPSPGLLAAGDEVRSDRLSVIRPQKAFQPVANPDAIKAAADLLSRSSQPMILAGGGARHASAEIQTLAEKLDAPVHMTINARGLLPNEHSLALPATGSFDAVRKMVNEADVVFAIGTELGATDYDMYKDDGFTIPGQLIRCDIDPAQLNNNFRAEIALYGDSATTAAALAESLPSQLNNAAPARAKAVMKQARAELTDEMKRHLQLLEAIRRSLPDVIFVGDSTQLIYSGNMLFNPDKPNRWFNSSVGFGTLGYALPAATGAALAAEGAPVVCLTGDGGLQFVLGELGALKDSGLAVSIIVWCNNGYREIKTSMENAGVSTVGVELAVPDFTAVAEAYGITGVRINSDTTLCETLVNAYKRNESILIELDENRMMS